MDANRRGAPPAPEPRPRAAGLNDCSQAASARAPAAVHVEPSPGALLMRSTLRLLAAALGLALAAGPAAAATHNVTVRNFRFEPADLTIQVGDTVVWTAVEGSHNVRANDNSFTSGPVQFAPWTFQHTFNAAGDFGYRCQLHGLPMSGIVRVSGGGGGGGEPGNLRLANGNVNVGEGGTATISVQRVGGDDGAVSVSYATSNGTAQSGADYQPRSGTLNWANGDDSPKSFQVPTVQDTAVESAETINVVLSNPTGGAGLGVPSAGTITIGDNDVSGTPGTLSFSVATFAGAEGGAAQIVVRRTGGTTGQVSARLMTHDGTAIGGADFSHLDQVVTFGPGDAANKTIPVAIVDDAVPEPVETLHVMLTAPTGGASLGDPSMAAVNVSDDDAATGPCVEDAETLCLTGGRFRVTVDFQPPGEALRPAQKIDLTDDSGLFWFFNATNVEMLVKVLNACVPPFDRFWVFYAATTNVAFTVHVVDTETGTLQQYSNQQGQAALPVQDTDAFATCP